MIIIIIIILSITEYDFWLMAPKYETKCLAAWLSHNIAENNNWIAGLTFILWKLALELLLVKDVTLLHW